MIEITYWELFEVLQNVCELAKSNGLNTSLLFDAKLRLNSPSADGKITFGVKFPMEVQNG